MSQYGAYGAARKGLSWKQILAFYYPGTRLTRCRAGTKIKVWITADNDNSLRVLPPTASPFVTQPGIVYTVPTGANTPHGESVVRGLATGSVTGRAAAAM